MNREEEIAEVVETAKNQLVSLEASLKRMAGEAKKLKDPSWIQVKTTISLLDGLYEQASNVLLKLEGLQGPQKMQRREPVMAIYLNAKVELEELAQSVRPAPVSGSSNSVLDQTVQQSTGRSDHLPRIELPRFNGSPTEWLAFKARFEKRIVTIGEDADKFAFLTKCLERFEPARNSIEALENSGTSFADAWAKLEDRFYKRRIAFESYFAKLLRIKKAVNPTAKGILTLIDAVDTTVHAALQIHGQRNHTLDCVADGLIIAVVKSKLDDKTLSRLEESLDLQKLFSWTEFKSELEKRANQLACHSEFDGGRNVKTVAVASVPRPSTEKGQNQSQKIKSCFSCGTTGEHSIFHCVAFNKLPIKERWNAVAQHRRCYNCLSQGHPAQKCPSNVSCKECGMRHHTLLHSAGGENASPSTSTQEKNNESAMQASAATSNPK